MKILKSLVLSLAVTSPAVIADVVIVASPSGPENLSESDVKDIYLNRSGAATPYEIEEGNALRREFHDWITGRTDSQLKSFWAQQTFTGEGDPPTEVRSSADMVRTVANTPDGIGYADPADVDDSVKVILKP